MKTITIDDVTYELRQIETEVKNTPIKEVETTAYKEITTPNGSMKLSVTLKDDGAPFVFDGKIQYDITKGDDCLDSVDWNSCVYGYFKTGVWDNRHDDRDYADEFTEDEKAEFIALIDKAKELNWI